MPKMGRKSKVMIWDENPDNKLIVELKKVLERGYSYAQKLSELPMARTDIPTYH